MAGTETAREQDGNKNDEVMDGSGGGRVGDGTTETHELNITMSGSLDNMIFEEAKEVAMHGYVDCGISNPAPHEFVYKIKSLDNQLEFNMFVQRSKYC